MLILEQSVEKVILKKIKKQKKVLPWPNYIALRWITCFVLRAWRLRQGHVFFFTRPTDSNFSRQEKNPYDWTLFFYFKFPTDRLGIIGPSLIRHSRNQPTVALVRSGDLGVPEKRYENVCVCVFLEKCVHLYLGLS